MGFLLRKIIGNKYGMLVVGVVALGAGLFLWNRTDVTCDGQVMSQGDQCEHTKRGRTTSINSYDEEKANQALSGKIITGIGGALTLGGAGWIIVPLVRRKPEESPAEAVTTLA